MWFWTLPFAANMMKNMKRNPTNPAISNDQMGGGEWSNRGRIVRSQLWQKLWRKIFFLRHFHKIHAPQVPIMCPTWQLQWIFFSGSASELKIPLLKGFVPPTHFQKQVGWRNWLAFIHFLSLFICLYPCLTISPNYIHFYQFFINCSPFSSSSSTVMHVQCSSMLSNFSLFRFLNPIYLTPPCSLPLWVSHWGLLVKQFLCRNYHRCHNHSFLLVYFFFVRFFVFFDNLEHGQWSVPSLCFSSGSQGKSYQSQLNSLAGHKWKI